VNFIEDWYDEYTRHRICHAFGLPDQQREPVTTFTWIDRGWNSYEQFEAHTKASLLAVGHCVIARKLSYRDAYVLHKRLFRCGIATSVLLLGDIDSIPTDNPCCKNRHEMVRTPPPPPQSHLFRRYCDTCQNIIDNNVEFIINCEPCNYDKCWLCFCIERDVKGKVLFGRNEGSMMSYPPPTAGDEAAPPQRPTDRDLEAVMLFNAANESATSNTNSAGSIPEDLINVLSSLIRGLHHNKKPGTKPSVIQSLQHKLVGVDDIKDLPEDSCVICMNEFLNGDYVTSLPCGHWFHSGKDTHDKDVEASADLCDGIIPWLKKNNDCKNIINYIIAYLLIFIYIRSDV
jgi:hypothetical protein